jgi:hypothetical protein
MLEYVFWIIIHLLHRIEKCLSPPPKKYILFFTVIPSHNMLLKEILSQSHHSIFLHKKVRHGWGKREFVSIKQSCTFMEKEKKIKLKKKKTKCHEYFNVLSFTIPFFLTLIRQWIVNLTHWSAEFTSNDNS